MNLTKDSYFTFSGGEVHCAADLAIDRIVMRDYTMNGFMALAEYVEAIRRSFPREYKINVVYPYFPYARQDRVMVENEPFSLKVFCELLNSLKLDSVTIYDPHSDVAPALINNCKVVPQWEIAKQVIPENLRNGNIVHYVCPDAGAYKKISKLAPATASMFIGTKERDESGQITGTDIFPNGYFKGFEFLIVDDICDGGRTFIELAKVLKRRGAESLYLYITHGIFSKGVEELFKWFDVIYTTDSFDQSRFGKSPQLVVKELFGAGV